MSNRIKGCDNLEIISTGAGTNYPMGTEILSGSVTAHASARLASLSNAFQRIKWHSLAFTIEGAYPTTSGGGYVACFVRDPDDIPPENPQDAVRWAMAQQQSADAKWYDSVKLNVGSTPDLLFTSQGSEPRLYSPGTLFVISKGGPAQVGSLTVNFHWDVTLSEPTSEVKNLNSNLWSANSDYYIEFAIQGLVKLQKVTTPAPDPHNVVFAAVTPTDLGLAGLADGSYIRLKTPRMITGEYNAANDYIPVYVTGFAVWQNALVAISELGGQYFILSVGTITGTLPGYTGTNWHILSGGFGAIVEELESLEIFRTPELSAPSSLMKRLPRAAFKPYGQVNQTVQSGIDPNVALTNLTGERYPASLIASLRRW